LIVRLGEAQAIAEGLQSAYLTPDTLLTIHKGDGKKSDPRQPARLRVFPEA